MIDEPDQTPTNSQASSTPETVTVNKDQIVKELYSQNVKVATKDFDAMWKSVFDWAWSHRMPLLILGAIAIAPKFILLWIAIVLAKPCCDWVYRQLPRASKEKLEAKIPKRFKESQMLRDAMEGADQGLPFILFWVYLCLAPFALIWIISDWIKGFLPLPVDPEIEADHLTFRQNIKRDLAHAESNFYHSRVFSAVIIAFFLSGIPALLTYNIYKVSGMERAMESERSTVGVYAPSFGGAFDLTGYPTSAPGTAIRNRPVAAMNHIKMYGPEGSDVTVIQGYNGYWPWLGQYGLEVTKSSVFWVHFYLVSVAVALTLVFFRSWFSFPLKFLTDEHDIQLTEDGLKRTSFKGWLLSVVTFNRFAVGAGPDSLLWSEVKRLKRAEEGFTKLYPLPETAFKKESLTYKLLNKVAAFIDGVSRKTSPESFLVFSTTEKGADFGRNLKIDLKDLTREQRAKLFYAVRKWAPHVVIEQSAEEELLGSTVLRDARYTQLWFDMLTTRTRSRRTDTLNAGEELKNSTYTIQERITSGGQSTTYLATNALGEKCVLKEFILSTSSDSGAMVESAREFEAEVSLLSQVSHPGIVKLEDYFFESGRLYVVLEHIQGQSLRQRVLTRGALSETETTRIAEAVCEVLEYLHGCDPPIIHRDITPENILLTPEGRVKLIDFSLAVKQDGKRTTDSCAKQCFTPPEQFREEATTQSDIYALGATMYFLLTGWVPKPISKSSPRDRCPHVSAHMNSIVERATALDLAQRYESAHWLKLDLGNDLGNDLKLDLRKAQVPEPTLVG